MILTVLRFCIVMTIVWRFLEDDDNDYEEMFPLLGLIVITGLLSLLAKMELLRAGFQVSRLTG